MTGVALPFLNRKMGKGSLDDLSPGLLPFLFLSLCQLRLGQHCIGVTCCAKAFLLIL